MVEDTTVAEEERRTTDRRVVGSPRPGGIDQRRATLVQRLALARDAGEIDSAVEEADSWLFDRPYDRDVRLARDAAMERRAAK